MIEANEDKNGGIKVRIAGTAEEIVAEAVYVCACVVNKFIGDDMRLRFFTELMKAIDETPAHTVEIDENLLNKYMEEKEHGNN